MPDTLPKPSAWVLVEHLEKGQTRYNAYLWFSDPQSSAWMPIYTPEVLAEVRRQALEDAARVCDATPPYPFRASIEAAHAIRAMKDKP